MKNKGIFSRLWRRVSGRESSDLRNLIYETSDKRDESIKESDVYKQTLKILGLEIKESQQKYQDLEKSIEATNAQIARGQLSAYEKEMKRLEFQIQSYKQSERDIGERYGEEQSERIKLDKELKRLKEEYTHTEALLENDRKTLKERDRLIGLLKKSVHEKEEKILVLQLERVCEFFDTYGSASVILINPENKIKYCSEKVKEQLNCNGDFIDKPYYELLNTENVPREEVIKYFNNPRKQDVVVSVVSGKGKKMDVHIAKYPLFGFDRRHLMTIVTVSSVGFFRSRTKEIRGKRLEAQLQAEIDRDYDGAITEDKLRQIKRDMERTNKEIDRKIEEREKEFSNPPEIPVSHQLESLKDEENKDSSET